MGSLANEIINFRARYDLTQEQFAQMCRITKQTISNVETGKRAVSKITEAKITQVIEKYKNKEV